MLCRRYRALHLQDDGEGWARQDLPLTSRASHLIAVQTLSLCWVLYTWRASSYGGRGDYESTTLPGLSSLGDNHHHVTIEIAHRSALESNASLSSDTHREVLGVALLVLPGRAGATGLCPSRHGARGRCLPRPNRIACPAPRSTALPCFLAVGRPTASRRTGVRRSIIAHARWDAMKRQPCAIRTAPYQSIDVEIECFRRTDVSFRRPKSCREMKHASLSLPSNACRCIVSHFCDPVSRPVPGAPPKTAFCPPRQRPPEWGTAAATARRSVSKGLQPPRQKGKHRAEPRWPCLIPQQCGRRDWSVGQRAPAASRRADRRPADPFPEYKSAQRRRPGASRPARPPTIPAAAVGERLLTWDGAGWGLLTYADGRMHRQNADMPTALLLSSKLSYLQGCVTCCVGRSGASQVRLATWSRGHPGRWVASGLSSGGASGKCCTATAAGHLRHDGEGGVIDSALAAF